MEEAGYFHGKQWIGVFWVEFYGVEFFRIGAVEFLPAADAQVVQDLEEPTAVFGFEGEQGSVGKGFPSFGRSQPRSEFGAVGLGMLVQAVLEELCVFLDFIGVGKGGEATRFVGYERIVGEDLFEEVGFGWAEFKDDGGVVFFKNSHDNHWSRSIVACRLKACSWWT